MPGVEAPCPDASPVVSGTRGSWMKHFDVWFPILFCLMLAIGMLLIALKNGVN